MTTLLAKLFIRNHTETTNPKVRQAYGILCSMVGIFLNILLFLGKFFAGTISHSIAITADSVNNLSDAGSSVVTLLGFKLAGQKPDSEHPFGHGRLEYISGLAVAFLILLMAVELFKSSVDKILHPSRPECSAVVIVILAASILVKGYMALYNRRIGKAIRSVAMAATATDSLSDMCATSVVLIATLLSHFTGMTVDGYCGLAVSCFIAYAGINAAKDTINPLLGQAPEPEFVERIHDLVMAHEGIIGIHDLVVHNYGPGRVHISLHAEVPADGDILVLHDLIDVVEHELYSTLNCTAVIHMDPVSINDPETNELKKMVREVLDMVDTSIDMHDFRIVKGTTHTNLIFDVVVPYEYKLTDGALVEIISYKIQESHPEYFSVINVDKK